MSKQLIDQIYNQYLILQDSVRVVRKASSEQLNHLFKNTVINYQTIDDDVSNAIEELEGLMIVSLFAAFERWLRDTILLKSEILLTVMPEEFGKELFILASNEIERWRTKEIIRLFTFISKEYSMKMIQITDYRNWIAHGKSKEKLPSIKTDIQTVYQTVRVFMEDVEKVL
ncbi:hypothetical protein P9265_18865 [Schinkia azotoformans]|uniref:hypothetical protein n=1 Tax=Schinkia azotoformans TaxID=1454 RepID=UPI002E21505B|nr:hypothetical protein [Schinkia azotoformans]